VEISWSGEVLWELDVWWTIWLKCSAKLAARYRN
jgi:hypothetical protein